MFNGVSTTNKNDPYYVYSDASEKLVDEMREHIEFLEQTLLDYEKLIETHEAEAATWWKFASQLVGFIDALGKAGRAPLASEVSEKKAKLKELELRDEV